MLAVATFTIHHISRFIPDTQRCLIEEADIMMKLNEIKRVFRNILIHYLEQFIVIRITFNSKLITNIFNICKWICAIYVRVCINTAFLLRIFAFFIAILNYSLEIANHYCLKINSSVLNVLLSLVFIIMFVHKLV